LKDDEYDKSSNGRDFKKNKKVNNLVQDTYENSNRNEDDEEEEEYDDEHAVVGRDEEEDEEAQA
jgi:hypothetical protein